MLYMYMYLSKYETFGQINNIWEIHLYKWMHYGQHIMFNIFMRYENWIVWECSTSGSVEACRWNRVKARMRSTHGLCKRCCNISIIVTMTELCQPTKRHQRHYQQMPCHRQTAIISWVLSWHLYKKMEIKMTLSSMILGMVPYWTDTKMMMLTGQVHLLGTARWLTAWCNINRMVLGLDHRYRKNSHILGLDQRSKTIFTKTRSAIYARRPPI